MKVINTNFSQNTAFPTISGPGGHVLPSVPPLVSEVTIVGDGFVGSEHTVEYVASLGFPKSEISIQWEMNGEPVAEADSVTFTPTFAGNLTVVVYASNTGAGDDSLESSIKAITESLPDAPVVTNAGTLTSDGTLGKVGSSHAVIGSAFTGIDTTVFYQWNRNGSPISGATSSNYVAVEADAGSTLTRTITVSNSSGSDDATTAGQAITYEAPVAIDTGVWSEDEDSGTKTFSVASFFTVVGDDNLSGVTWSIVNAVAGSTINSSGVISITTANALTGTITARATNSGGSADTTVDLTVLAPPITAPSISALSARNYSDGSGNQTYSVAALTTGTAPITYSVDAKVGQVVITEQSENVYYANVLYGGSGTVTITYDWEVDGVSTGVVADTFDNTTGAYDGNLTCVVTADNGQTPSSLESAAVAIEGVEDPGGGGEVVNPVHLETEASGLNTGNLNFSALCPAFSTGDLIVVSAGLDRGSAQVTPVTLVAPNAETVTTFINGHQNTLLGTSGTSQWVFWFIGGAPEAEASNLALTCSQNAEQWGVTASVFDAGTFDPTDPLQLIGTPTFSDTNASVLSSAGTATLAGGKILFMAACDAENITSTPAGWTLGDAIDTGAQAAYAATRDALSTAGESVAAATFAQTVADTWCAVTVMVNPLVTEADYSEYNAPGDVEPKLALDFHDEVYLADDGAGLAEVTTSVITGFTSLETTGAIQRMATGGTSSPRIATDNFTFSGTAGTILVRFRFDDLVEGDHIFNLNDGTANNRISPYYQASSGNFRQLARVGGASTGAASTGLWVDDTAQCYVIAWGGGSYSSSLDGATAVSAAGTIPTGLISLVLGANNGTGNTAEGGIERVVYWDQKLSNADIATLSGA
jgi:hypothetical protein